jgi:hypothetical protein
VNLLKKYIYSISLKVIFHQISFTTMDVPLIETNGKYEDSFLSVQSKYIVFTQYTHKKKKNLPNCDQYMFVRRICKVNVKGTGINIMKIKNVRNITICFD